MKLIRWWPVVLAAVVAAGALPWVLFWDDIPDPVATHWGLTGPADGHTPRTTEVLVTASATLVLAAAATLLTLRRSRALGVLSATWLLTGLGAGILGSTALANRGATHWRQADMSLLLVAAALVPMVLLGRLGSEIARRNNDLDLANGPRLDLRPGETAAWSGTAHARWRWAVAFAVVVGVIALRGRGPEALVMLGLIALLGAAFSSVRVTVGANGLRVRPGLVAWPAVRLPLRRILSAQAIDARPLQWGGWGYRGSIRLFRRAAWLVRRGDGLQVNLTDRSVFLVSVDDAEQAAAVLNGLLSRQPTPTM